MAKVLLLSESHEAKTYMHHCPGCGHRHRINTGRPNSLGAIWRFRGTVDNPSFHPSIKISTGERVECHYWITKGNIIYEQDSAHELKGKTVPLPDINYE